MTERAIYLLCGGRSRRLGRDKRLIDVGGKPLVDGALAQLTALGLPIILGLDAADDRIASRPAVARWWDVEPGRGPLPNLVAALQRWGGELLLCAADRIVADPARMPALLEFADRSPTAWAVVFEIAGQPEPMHGLYRPGLVKPLARAWSQGRESLRDFLAELPEGRCARLAIDQLGIDLNSSGEVIPMRTLAKELP